MPQHQNQQAVIYRRQGAGRREVIVVAVGGEAITDLSEDVGLEYRDLGLPVDLLPDGAGLWILKGSYSEDDDGNLEEGPQGGWDTAFWTRPSEDELSAIMSGDWPLPTVDGHDTTPTMAGPG